MSAMPELKLFLVDDDDLVRRGLCDWLATIEGVTVVGDAPAAEEALEQLEKLEVDIAVLDLMLPGVSGIKLAEEISNRFPKIKSLLLSGTMTPEVVFEAFSAGACGCLPKRTEPDELKVALRHIIRNNWYLSPVVTKDVLARVDAFRSGEASSSVGLETPLSIRERELLKLIAEGHTFAEIARQFDLNPRSIERLKAKLEEKLGAHGLTDLIRVAIKLDIIQP